MSKSVLRSLVLLTSLLGASSAQATSFTLAAIMDGLQETPPVVTTGTGLLSGAYDDVTNALSWSGSFSLLLGTTTDAHFHGPAAIGVGPAGVQVAANAGSGDVFPIGVTTGVFSGSAVLTEAQETMLLSGLMYFNIHSSFSPGGEIRGQVLTVPEPPTLFMLGLGVLGLVIAGRRRRR